MISIDIYTDTICPWCYIGQKKLQSAISNFSNNNFDILWRPFQLNPDMPIEGINRNEYLQKKFGDFIKTNMDWRYIRAIYCLFFNFLRKF